MIYNAFDDKDIFGVLSSLKPFIDTILVYNYPSQNRKLAVDRIIELSKELKIKCFEFKNLDEKEQIQEQFYIEHYFPFRIIHF